MGEQTLCGQGRSPQRWHELLVDGRLEFEVGTARGGVAQRKRARRPEAADPVRAIDPWRDQRLDFLRVEGCGALRRIRFGDKNVRVRGRDGDVIGCAQFCVGDLLSLKNQSTFNMSSPPFGGQANRLFGARPNSCSAADFRRAVFV
jgi:hypothetical protein